MSRVLSSVYRQMTLTTGMFDGQENICRPYPDCGDPEKAEQKRQYIKRVRPAQCEADDLHIGFCSVSL
jgi:hypothetical protein